MSNLREGGHITRSKLISCRHITHVQ